MPARRTSRSAGSSRAARSAGLRPILCVGELLADRDAGRAEHGRRAPGPGRLDGRRSRGPRSDDGAPWLTIAYEPVWAIGTGRNARGSDAAAMAGAIRAALADLGIRNGGDVVPILYGGSVSSANIDEFLAEPGRSTARSSAGRRSSRTRWPGSSPGPGPRRPAQPARPAEPAAVMADRPRPIVLVILDGFGIGGDVRGDAIAAARMPVWRGLLARWPHALLEASAEAVGLPPGQMGNSEVGHLNLGAGRPVLQDLPRIDAAIADGSFFERPALVDACRRAIATTGRLDVVGLIGPGGVHANDRHIVALAELAARTGVRVVPAARAARRP